MIKEPDHEKEFFADLLLMKKVDRRLFDKTVDEMDSKKFYRFIDYVSTENVKQYYIRYMLSKLKSFLKIKKQKKDE